ncbi:CAP domain-containing protein [Cognatitamlana onchidii]|uniref:CAP domain-containing protein n=1 Tax=Cognatitamlana onchidii TaxID=2562860 RepID=UPI0010A68D29|nr:CAP domain-containing protein [Algibacter onchidii]
MKTIYAKARQCFICVVAAICIMSCSNDEVDIPVDDDSSEDIINVEASAIETEILQLVNNHRSSIGKSKLEINNLAAVLAKEHTLYMINKGDISHDNFDERGDRLISEEQAIKVGENVAFKYRTAKEVMEAWLNSPGHKANIEANFTHIGISAIKDNSGFFYYTQVFFRK